MGLINDNKHYREVDPKTARLLHEQMVGRVLMKSRFAGRFLLPQESRERTNMARIENISPSYKGPVKLGDVIIFASWEGREWQSPDETLILLDPDNVVAIIDTEENDDTD